MFERDRVAARARQMGATGALPLALYHEMARVIEREAEAVAVRADRHLRLVR